MFYPQPLNFQSLFKIRNPSLAPHFNKLNIKLNLKNIRNIGAYAGNFAQIHFASINRVPLSTALYTLTTDNATLKLNGTNQYQRAGLQVKNTSSILYNKAVNLFHLLKLMAVLG